MNFLERSEHFDSSVVLELLPQDYLLKEKALLLAKSRKTKEALNICID